MKYRCVSNAPGLHNDGTCDSYVRCQACFCLGQPCPGSAFLWPPKGCYRSVCLRRVQRNYSENLQGRACTKWSGQRLGTSSGQMAPTPNHVLPPAVDRSAASMLKSSCGRNQPDWERGQSLKLCQRSSHDPEAVHLHLTHTHLNRVPLIVLGERVYILAATRQPVCRSLGMPGKYLSIAWQCPYIGVSGVCGMSRASNFPGCLLRSSPEYNSIF